MCKPSKISRRTVLRAAATTVALPWLEAMGPAVSSAADVAPGASSPPRRMAFIYIPNGVNLPEWTPTAVGFDFDLPPILQPLERVKNDVTVLSGLTHDKGRANGDGPGDHARAAATFLTGCQARKTDGANIRAGVSVDQIAAEQIGGATRFPSLELGCEKGRNSGNCDSGYSCAYSHNISWASPSTPMAKEIDPRLVFERLFSRQADRQNQAAERERLQMGKSLLDYVADDARRLHAKLGRADQRKLDEYLAAVRSIERRIERSRHEPTRRRTIPPYPKPGGIPHDYGAHVRLMADMIVLAFQADLTRIATCMFGRAGSNRSYRQIGVPEGHHALSHHGGNREKLAKISRINRYHVEQLAYLLERLKSIREGDGTLLDQCMIVYASGLSDGNRHNNENLPVLLAGRGGGTISSGRHVRYEQETPMCNLFLSMMDRMGVSVEAMGDSTGRLPGLA